MSAQHTPGRLYIRTNRHPNTDGTAWGWVDLYEAGSMKQASPEGVQVTWSRGQKSEANARRLVACWNACDGIETDHLERHGLPDFAKKISDLRAQHDELQKQVAEIAQLGMVLREQRDELLAALERTTEMCEQYADWIKRNVMSADIEEHPYLPELEGAAEDARAALAKVKGGAA